MLLCDLRHVHDAALADEVAQRLDDGQIGILPTETVFGLCCSAAHPAAMDRVFALKKRPSSMALPILAANASAALAYAGEATRHARRLAECFWPGPLTLVLGADPGQAVRVPRHAFTERVLDLCKRPIHATSVNRSGELAAVSPADISQTFLDAVDFAILDAPGPEGRESSIVRVKQAARPCLLRRGALAEEPLADCLRYRISVVCTGNTCRSPMAEALLRQALANALVFGGSGDPPGFRVRSFGVAAAAGDPASSGAIEAVRQFGIDLRQHRSTPTRDVLTQSDLVLCMTEGHRRSIMSIGPKQWSEKVQLLSQQGFDVVDPHGGSALDYRACLEVLRCGIQTWLPTLLAEGTTLDCTTT